MPREMTRAEIAKILQETRLKAGLTQQQAAEAIGRKRQTLASWETGKSQPDANTLFLLFAAYGASVNDAFGFNAQEEVSTQEHALLKKYRSLDVHGTDIVDMVLESEYSRMQNVKNRSKLLSQNDNIVQLTPTKKAGPKMAQEMFDCEASDGKTFVLGYVAAGHPIPETLTDLYIDRDNTVPAGTTHALIVSGDSMEPVIKDRSIIFVNGDADVQSGEVGIFTVDAEQTCKILVQNEDGSCQLESFNPKYKPIKIGEFTDFRAQGKVLLP